MPGRVATWEPLGVFHACEARRPSTPRYRVVPPAGELVMSYRLTQFVNIHQALKFENCMRSYGVRDFPDADRDGAFTLPSTINQQAPRFMRATTACAPTEPSSLSILTQSPPES